MRKLFIHPVLIVCVLLASVCMLLLAQPAQALPPRPPAPTSIPDLLPGFTGGAVELRARFSSTWPWATMHWQDLWTVVQWQDAQGRWHTVEGWQGTFDKVVAGAEVVAYKTWWVSQSDLGKGPFRWVVTRGKGGETIATSEAFNLPAANGTRTSAEVTLAP